MIDHVQYLQKLHAVLYGPSHCVLVVMIDRWRSGKHSERRSGRQQQVLGQGRSKVGDLSKPS